MPICDCGFPPFVPVRKPDGSVGLETGAKEMLRKGPTIQVEVGFEETMFVDPTQTLAVATQIAAGNARAGTFKIVEALVDTGAYDSCIDEELATELNLPIIDKQMCSGVGGQHELNVYLGHIRIPSLNQVRWGRFTGAKLKIGGQPHQALIGRAQLDGMILVYDGRIGAATLSI